MRRSRCRRVMQHTTVIETEQIAEVPVPQEVEEVTLDCPLLVAHVLAASLALLAPQVALVED